MTTEEQNNKNDKEIEIQQKERKLNWIFIIIASIQFLSMVGQVILIGFFYQNHNLEFLPIMGYVVIAIAFVFLTAGSIVLYESVEINEKKLPRLKFLEKGIYTIIRHPMYLGLGILFVGMMLISDVRWSAILAFPNIIIMYYYMIKEEQIALEKFGEEFDDYMKRVPRVDIFLGIYRRIKAYRKAKK